MTATIDFDKQTVGPLKLGGPVDEATRQSLEKDGCELEVDDGRLVCAKVDMDERMAVNVGDFRLTGATKPLDVLVWFGDPASDSNDGKKWRWIDFERGGATLALEFTDNRLSCVQLYGEGYA